MIKQQCYSISVAQVSVDTQQGGVVQDIATVIHISPSHNQQSAHLQKEKRKVTAELWWEIHSCVCEYALLPWYWGCRGCAVTQEQGSGSVCCMTATALAELRRKPLASYSGPGWGEQMRQKPTVRHKTVASHWFVICKKNLLVWFPAPCICVCLTLCVRARLVDVRLQDVMPELQCLLSGQLSCLSAEPEGQESVATPGNRDTQLSEKHLSLFSSLSICHSCPLALWLYLGSQRNRSSWPSSLHMSHSLKEVWFSIRLPSLRRKRNEESCSRRCENSAHSSEPPARVPAFTTSNSCALTVLYPLLATISMLALTEAQLSLKGTSGSLMIFVHKKISW